MGTFRIITLGCKVNQCESAGLSQKLSDGGWRRAADGEAAELVVVNTCAVTGKAAMQSRQAVRQALRHNPGARVVATGCYAQTDPQALAGIDGVAAVMGTGEKMSIADSPFLPPAAGPAIRCGRVAELRRFSPLPPWGGAERTRPFLKIQDGCNARCTYCIVPSARGPSRSLPPEQVLDRLRGLAEAGFRETVLTGIHLGNYGRDLSPPTRLEALLDQIDAAGVMDRIRLSSIEPGELTAAIIDKVAAGGRFCRHFHIPLQSGDDRVLRRMARPYTGEFFREKILTVHRAMPECAIGVDVMAGFPGETDEAFANTFRLLQELPVTYLHVFPFSPRAGTPAERMPDPVPAAVAKERCQQLRALGREKKQAFYARFPGRTVRVLVEGSASLAPGTLRGFSDNYLPVRFSGDKGLGETFVDVRIKGIGPDLELFGSRA